MKVKKTVKVALLRGFCCWKYELSLFCFCFFMIIWKGKLDSTCDGICWITQCFLTEAMEYAETSFECNSLQCTCKRTSKVEGYLLLFISNYFIYFLFWSLDVNIIWMPWSFLLVVFWFFFRRVCWQKQPKTNLL